CARRRGVYYEGYFDVW
nr:immunoglobulin heavy chain junction region [Mus musculus]